MAFDYNKLRGRIGETFQHSVELRKCNGMVGAHIVTKDEWNVFMEADRYL